MSDNGLIGISPIKNVHITVTRGMKGAYSWEISVHDDSLEVVERKVQEADHWLNATYGNEGT